MSDYREFKHGDDYLFQVSNIHLALQKLEGEVRLKNEEIKKKTEKEIQARPIGLRDKYVGFDFEKLTREGEFGFQIGLFSELKLSFKATEDLIKQNYLIQTSQSLMKATNYEEAKKSGKELIISYNNDKYILQDMLDKVNAYNQLMIDTKRDFYINRIRLRSIASQYVSFVPLLEDGHFFPFLIFTVLDCENGEKRMLELNFVEDVLHDRYKDHCCRSYHFSMLKRVNKGMSTDSADGGDDLFHIEFNNEKFHYKCIVPNQRDFIVGMITTAMEETQIAYNKNKTNNNPDNVNVKKDEFS